MTTEGLDNLILLPDPAEGSLAERLGRALAERLAQGEAIEVIQFEEDSGARQSLPVTAAKLLVKILAQIAKGNTVRVVTLKPDRRASLGELVALNQKFGVQVGEGQ
jgi:hypothetical protein